ncbi:AEC family transporter [Mesomycoplasma lagogenitalium]|uniref:AEC family transporter n=1 Tax=Mesomycoplasma lagogenitalium TaxID=171286 RepID=A0ABY8LTV7_9BACT|nr:AEC family transporter [Mesomycoplasma lagogenitalium]WGI36668.1 AEC family transporter [Mesomycoplasma lagogenitalium]
MDLLSQLKLTLSNQGLWGAIIASIGIIALGYGLTKFKLLKQEGKGIINQIVLLIALPALAFSGFMNTITIDSLIEQSIILAISFAFYILLNAIALLWVKFGTVALAKTKLAKKIGGENVTESKALVIWMMLIFGSTTFFGQPIIQAVYGNTGILAANIWNIPYRIFLYSLCFMLMARLKFNKENFTKSIKTALLNPIVIATFLGLIFWLSQLIPGGTWKVNETKYVGWFELKTTLPAIHKIFQTLGSLASPLIWITIGMTLAATPLKQAVSSVQVWLFCFAKLIVIPAIMFLVMLPFVKYGKVTPGVAGAMVIYAAVPPATVVIAYSMKYKMQETYSAQCSALSTLLAIIIMPIWILICGAAF